MASASQSFLALRSKFPLENLSQLTTGLPVTPNKKPFFFFFIILSSGLKVGYSFELLFYVYTTTITEIISQAN